MSAKETPSKLYTAKTLRQIVEEEDFDFEEEFPPGEGPPEQPVRIREYSEWVRGGNCSVCGEERDPYVELEVDGQWEFTCKECFEGRVTAVEATMQPACPTCGESIEAEDRFCGKCGAPIRRTCPGCGAEPDTGDRFCGKCGASL